METRVERIEENKYVVYSNGREYSVRFEPDGKRLYIGGIEVDIPKKDKIPFLGFDYLFNIDGVNYRCVLFGKEFNLVANRKHVGKDTGYFPMKVTITMAPFIYFFIFLFLMALNFKWDYIWMNIAFAGLFFTMIISYLRIFLEYKKQDGEA